MLDEAGYPRGADGVRFKVTLDHRNAYDLNYAEIVGYRILVLIGVDVETTVVTNTPTWVVVDSNGTYEMSSGNLAFPAALPFMGKLLRPDRVWGLRGWNTRNPNDPEYDAV